MSTTPASLTLLHLSDIHFIKGVSNVLSSDIDGVVRHELERDAVAIAANEAIAGIIVSGDLAFAGKTEEFQTAIDWLHGLSLRLGVDPSLVWTVPGNHDVDQSVIRAHTSLEPIHNDVRTSSQLHQTLEKHLRGNDGPLLFEPLRAYNETVGQRFGCLTKPDQPWWEFDLTLSDDSILRMRGVNSALISGEKDSKRESRKLCLGPAQYELRRDQDVTHLVICHHPMDWLVDGDDARRALKAYAKVILTGHKHMHEEEQVNETLWLNSGAVHPSRVETKWEPNYYMLRLCIEMGQKRWLRVDLYRRVWSEMQRAFVRPSGQDQDFKTYRLALEPRPNREVAQAKQTSSQEGEREVSLSRKKLLYAFVSLPYHTKVNIMEKLNLFDDSNRGLPDDERFASGFDRAVREQRLPEVWDAVDAVSRR